MTPMELNILSTVLGEKKQAEFEESVTLAWLGEMYHRQEKLPPLQTCLDELKPKEPKKEIMEDDEMMRMAMMLNAKYGGVVEEGKADLE